MAASTAAAQGIDRPHVKFVVIHGHSYGMLSYAQQGGRGGREGRPSYVILLRDPKDRRACPPYKDLDVKCARLFFDYTANQDVCRRKLLLNAMDGEERSIGCFDSPGCNPCDVCDPNNDMLRDIRAAAFPKETTHRLSLSAPSSGAPSSGHSGGEGHHLGLTVPIMDKVGEEGCFGKVRVS